MQKKRKSIHEIQLLGLHSHSAMSKCSRAHLYHHSANQTTVIYGEDLGPGMVCSHTEENCTGPPLPSGMFEEFPGMVWSTHTTQMKRTKGGEPCPGTVKTVSVRAPLKQTITVPWQCPPPPTLKGLK